MLNTNDNIRRDSTVADWDVKLRTTDYTGGQILPEKSELKHVLKRRKSRQSTRVPTVVDFEYVGNSAGSLNHHVQTHDKHQLDFELNLRQYKRQSDFLAD